MTGATGLLGSWLVPELFRLGAARFETGEYPLAIKNLDEALKLRPENARAVFVRARSKEKLGQSGVADLELAGRTAFANVNAPGSGGQAHLSFTRDSKGAINGFTVNAGRVRGIGFTRVAR